MTFNDLGVESMSLCDFWVNCTNNSRVDQAGFFFGVGLVHECGCITLAGSVGLPETSSLPEIYLNLILIHFFSSHTNLLLTTTGCAPVLS